MNDQPDFSKPSPDLRRQAERRMPAGAVPPAPTYLERVVHELLPDNGTILYARLHLAKPSTVNNVTARVAVVDISEIEYRGLDWHTASAKPPRPTGDPKS